MNDDGTKRLIKPNSNTKNTFVRHTRLLFFLNLFVYPSFLYFTDILTEIFLYYLFYFSVF